MLAAVLDAFGLTLEAVPAEGHGHGGLLSFTQAKWTEKNGYRIVDKLTGASAYRGKNTKEDELGALLAMIKRKNRKRVRLDRRVLGSVLAQPGATPDFFHVGDRVVTLAGGRRPRHRFLGQDNFALLALLKTLRHSITSN